MCRLFDTKIMLSVTKGIFSWWLIIRYNFNAVIKEQNIYKSKYDIFFQKQSFSHFYIRGHNHLIKYWTLFDWFSWFEYKNVHPFILHCRRVLWCGLVQCGRLNLKGSLILWYSLYFFNLRLLEYCHFWILLETISE